MCAKIPKKKKEKEKQFKNKQQSVNAFIFSIIQKQKTHCDIILQNQHTVSFQQSKTQTRLTEMLIFYFVAVNWFDAVVFGTMDKTVALEKS